jgi:hypothetical protein
MIVIYFSLIAEFEPEVVTGLDYSLLCVSWRKLRDCSKLITKEFHTSAFGYPNDKTTEKKHALAINKAAQESTDDMTLVITSNEQAESLHKLSAVMTRKKARSYNNSMNANRIHQTPLQEGAASRCNSNRHHNKITHKN